MVRRQDQRQTGVSRAGSGPAPQQNPLINPIIIVTPGHGIFIYNGTPGPGNLIGSWTATAGVDPYGNAFPKGINVTSGVLSGVVINALSEMLNPGPLFLDAPAGQTISVFTAAGVNNWTAPAGVTAADVYCWAAGGGGDGGDAGAGESGGGGGAFSFLGSVAVTPATVYHPTVGAGGGPNTAGGNTSFAGDVVTVTANGGQGAVDPSSGAGGLASTLPAGVTSFAGGQGGHTLGGGNAGAGGGGAAGQFGPGSQGGTGITGSPGAGGAAGTGFLFPSGAGGAGGAAGANGGAGVAPGGGGGGAGSGGATVAGSGANGQVVLVYSTGALSTIAGIASTTTTDPATGTVLNRGITSIDPVLGGVSRIDGNNITVTVATRLQLNGADFDVVTVGRGLRVAEGANAKQGVATLAAGTILVANTSVTATSRILVTPQDNNTTGALRISARVVGTSFTITSSNAADTGVVAFEIFEPG